MISSASTLRAIDCDATGGTIVGHDGLVSLADCKSTPVAFVATTCRAGAVGGSGAACEKAAPGSAAVVRKINVNARFADRRAMHSMTRAIRKTAIATTRQSAPLGNNWSSNREIGRAHV